MRYYVPDLALPDKNLGLRERLGGVPFGLDLAAWPRCRDCGKSLSLLAQFDHNDERLDLGRAGRALLIFQCNHDPGMCETWDAFSGANACLVIEPEDIGESDTEVPEDLPPLDNAVLVRGWIARDDAVPEQAYDAFFTQHSFASLPRDVAEASTWVTRLGSAPSWVQSADETPKPDWRFLGQLDGTYSFYQAPDHSVPWVRPDAERYQDRTHWGEGPNFGDGGIAYLFTRPADTRPEVVMFWQCG